MKKLSKEQCKQHAAISAALSSAQEDIKSAVEIYNEKVKALFAEILQPEVDAFNKAKDDATTFLQEIHGEQESFYDERSEKWQEGDAGSSYQDWMGTWELEIEELELEEPTPFEEPTLDGVDEFEGLSLEVDS